METAHEQGQHVDQVLAQLAPHHERARQHEERDGHQRETLGLRDQLLHDEVRTQAVRGQQANFGSNDQRVRDRQTEKCQKKKTAEDDD